MGNDISIQSYLNSATEQLAQSNITETPRLDAETLLMHALNINRAYLYGHFDDNIPESKLLMLNNYLSQRLSGMPIAYILGEKEFWSLNFPNSFCCELTIRINAEATILSLIILFNRSITA